MKKRWYHRFMFWKKNKRYVVILCYKGQAEYFSALKFAKTQAQARQIASDLLYNTIGWQALIFRWNPFYQCVEHFDSEQNTFPREEEIALERLNAYQIHALRYSAGEIVEIVKKSVEKDGGQGDENEES